MGESSRKLEAGLPKEETQRVSGNRWGQKGSRVGEDGMCRGRGEHGDIHEEERGLI